MGSNEPGLTRQVGIAVTQLSMSEAQVKGSIDFFNLGRRSFHTIHQCPRAACDVV